jgi:hypothetical protein
VHLWAFCSLSCSAWAREFYDEKVAAGKSANAALRALGNRGLEVLWHCLCKNVRYDEDTHAARRAKYHLDRAARSPPTTGRGRGTGGGRTGGCPGLRGT